MGNVSLDRNKTGHVKRSRKHRIAGMSAACLFIVVLAVCAIYPDGVVSSYNSAVESYHDDRWGLVTLNPKENQFVRLYEATHLNPLGDEGGMSSMPVSIFPRGKHPTLKSIIINVARGAELRNVWFYKDGEPNFYSSQTLVESLVGNKQLSDEEKVVRVFNATFKRLYHNDWPIVASGISNDPITVLTLGFGGKCDNACYILESLFQMIGFRTRPAGITIGGLGTDHRAMEVEIIGADGNRRWVYCDPDGRMLYRREDGQYASIDDLRRNPELVLAFTDTNRDHQYCLKTIAAAITKGNIHIYPHDSENEFALAERQLKPANFSKYRHTMRFDLLSGARLELTPRRQEVFTPHVPAEFRYFANGRLSYSFVRGRDEALNPLREYNLIPVCSPWILVKSRLSGKTDRSAKLYVYPIIKGPGRQVKKWKILWEGTGEFDIGLDGILDDNPLFAYIIKASSGFKTLNISSDFIFGPDFLPRLKPGENVFIFYAPKGSIKRLGQHSGEWRSVISINRGEAWVQINYR